MRRRCEAAGVAVSTASVPLHHLELPVELEDGYGRHGFEDVVHDVDPSRLRDRRGQRRRAPELRGAPRRGLLPGPAHRRSGAGRPTPSRRAGSARSRSCDEIWVYSRFMAENIGAVAPVPDDRAAAAGAAARRAGRAAAPGRARRGLPVPVRVRLPEHDPAQEPGRPDRGVQARLRARRGPAAADEDDQRAAAPAGRGGGAVGRARPPGHPRDRPLAERRRS